MQYVFRIVVNPSTGTVFAATAAGGIKKSTDNGVTWTTAIGVTNDNYYSDIIVFPSGLLVAYLSYDGPNTSKSYTGIYYSTDDGSTWTQFNHSNFPLAHKELL